MKLAKGKSESAVGFAPGKRQEARLELPGGEPDLEALRSVARDWLVPRLVDKFLRLHGIQPRISKTIGNTTKSTMTTFSRRDLLM